MCIARALCIVYSVCVYEIERCTTDHRNVIQPIVSGSLLKIERVDGSSNYFL